MKSNPNPTMTERLLQAIEQLKALPESEQDRLAGMLIRAMGDPDARSASTPGIKAKDLLELTQEFIASIPESELSKLPTDLASEHDHYIYGTPKRNP